MLICDCRIFRLLPHFSVKCAYHIFFRIHWHFWRNFNVIHCFYCLFLLGFVTSTIWLPTAWHHPCVQTPVERDGVVGFKQFCTTFPLHISCLCSLHIFLQMLHNTDMPDCYSKRRTVSVNQLDQQTICRQNQTAPASQTSTGWVKKVSCCTVTDISKTITTVLTLDAL